MPRLSAPILIVGVVAAATGCASGPSVVQRAAMLSEVGRDQEAMGILEAYLDAHPDAVPERRLLVRIYGASGRLDAARRHVEALARQLGPGSAIPHIELGTVLELSHRYEDALDLYDQAARAAPEDPTGPRVGGLRAARWGESELARPRLEEAAKRDPNDAEVWHALGLVRMHLGDVVGARRAYREGLRVDPRALENRLGLATVALRARDPGAALEQYEHILRERPDNPGALLGRSWSFILLGRLDAARATLRDAARAGADPRALRAQRRALADLEARRPSRDNH